MNKLFNVPSHMLGDFSEMLVENELVNEIKGRTDDDEIIIEVNYRSDQKGSILDLVEWLEDSIEAEDDSDDDDVDEDEDDSDESTKD